jgi:hypothetical protein
MQHELLFHTYEHMLDGHVNKLSNGTCFLIENPRDDKLQTIISLEDTKSWGLWMQIVERKTGRFENLVRFLPGFQLRAKAQSE